MMQNTNILVVDDERSSFTVIQNLLSPQGYSLFYVASGEDAFTYLGSRLPDVILLDVMMPNLDGLETCRRIKANSFWQHIPVIMVTALNSKRDLALCIEAGADDFITKPVNGLELRARVRSMLRIKNQYDALQTTLSLREDLTQMIVHDLRNPLASILLATELLKQVDIPPERQQQKIGQIAIAGQQMQSLIDSLLLLAKLESGTMILRREDIDPNILCTTAVSLIEPLATQKKLKLVKELPEHGGSVSVDVNILRRVLDNLLSNSVKFAPSGSQILLRASYPTYAQAQIQVSDFGPGVPKAVRDIIFEKYEIGTLIQDTSQIGLGLAFCKLAVEAHGGHITVEDNHPQGSVFTISLGDN